MTLLSSLVRHLSFPLFDAHVNVARYPYLDLHDNEPWDFDESVQRLLTAMAECRVQKAFVCSFESICYNFVSGNRQLAEMQRNHVGRLYGLATVHPLMKSARDALSAAAGDQGLVGLKLHPVYQRFHPLCDDVHSLMELCAALRLPVMIHCGTTHAESSPELLTVLARRHPSVRFIFAHMGGTNCHKTAECVRDLDNVLVETSVSRPVFEPIIKVARTIGIGRIMFGSDFPCGSPSVEIARVLDCRFSDTELEQVLYSNAFNLLKDLGKA
jgi:predicted TIM-barrel fold metal-dependent hydrolase